MINRIKKLRLIQFGFLVAGMLIIFFTYSANEFFSRDEILPQETQEKIKKLNNQQVNDDIFFNIEYSGLDLAGNRYVLKSKEAFNSKDNQDIVNMKSVEAFFYFKDNTVLKVRSDKGIYNNKTLDMKFNKNVKAIYEGSKLFAQKAEYSNLNSFLIISEEVEINDVQGTIFADKLLFDIKKQTLNIASFENNKINANIDLK